ncbi:hypothetical protein CYY_008608 [Polysphondylium violaceum]|uniref:SET domain-containing protein n=1 Tax=Polysphondylium violaceum TaxID=133409 RepID=A0A8J4PN48_9MYCE|nr:hypothetical protein CYY_008608 [Polysphondylium violaceum]
MSCSGVKQRRLSKSKALNAIGHFNDTGTYERPIPNATQSRTSPSSRMTINAAKKKELVECYVNDNFAPTEIIYSKGKGNGVKVLQDTQPGQLVVEYKGDLINKVEATKREKLYASNSTTSRMECYLFYFDHKGKVMCIDSTIPKEEMGTGRYINHRVEGNLDPVKISVNGVPKIVLISNKLIKGGEELFFDYGDRSSKSLTFFPWLRDDFNPGLLSDEEEKQSKSKSNIHFSGSSNSKSSVNSTSTSPNKSLKRSSSCNDLSSTNSTNSAPFSFKICNLYLSPSKKSKTNPNNDNDDDDHQSDDQHFDNIFENEFKNIKKIQLKFKEVIC